MTWLNWFISSVNFHLVMKLYVVSKILQVDHGILVPQTFHHMTNAEKMNFNS